MFGTEPGGLVVGSVYVEVPGFFSDLRRIESLRQD